MGITLDFTNCLAESIGATHGLTKPEIDTLVAKFPKHHENVDELRTRGESGFFDLPYQDQGALKAVLKKHQGKWDDLIVVAMGGAAAAIRGLLGALTHHAFPVLVGKARKGAPRIHVIDNSDPALITDIIEVVDLKKTLVYAVSRSGSTTETLAITLWLAEQLKKKAGKTALATQLVVATDPERGGLADLAKLEKCDLLPIPANLGGRFSALGNPGLFVAALCGVDITALLAGAAEMDKRCRHGDAFKNPAYMHSLVHYLLTRKRRKTIHETIAFSNRLYSVTEWYAHLCSVSLGKMLNRKGKAVHVGPAPMIALGSSALHGSMQLSAEGPFDKVITFITAKDHGSTITAPASYPKVDSLAFAGGAECATLLEQNFIAAEQCITASGRPNCTIILDQVDAHHVGGLIYLIQLSIVMSAELYGIDPFDQPGVEHNKHAVFAQLGRPGFEDLAKKLTEHRKQPRRVC